MFGGLLVDRWGVRPMTVATTGLALLGQSLVIVGVNQLASANTAATSSVTHGGRAGLVVDVGGSRRLWHRHGNHVCFGSPAGG